jgi:hypothetical protein
MARKLLILLGALAFALALPAAAQAATFCVRAPQCVGEPHLTLQDALAAADTPEFPGRDRVELGTGEYAGPFTADGDNAVEIVGVGQGETVLTAAGDGVTVLSLAAASSAVHRVTVRLATGIGVRLTGGPAPAVLENVTVELTGGSGTGVEVGPGPTMPVSATLRQVTVAGSGTGIGLDVTASASSGASATISSSVITRFEFAIRATDGACPAEPCTPPLATVTTDHSAYGSVTGTRPEAVSPAAVSADPKLGTDLRPAFDSPLIDAADPIAAAAPLDASGLPRVVDGDGKDGARSDIGALEYQRRAPAITATLASPTSAVAGAAIGFSAAAIDPDGEAVRASWAFSDGATGSGFDVAHAFGAPGAASATVTVTDAAGVSATATVPVTITAAPPVGVDPPPAGSDPPPTPRRSFVIARVLPDALVLRADRRRDRRAPYRFRLRGRVVLPEGISAAGCAGGAVQLAIRTGKRRITRSAKLAADCSFRRTLKLGRKRARRVVVTPRFGGTGALAPLDGGKLRLRAG